MKRGQRQVRDLIREFHNLSRLLTGPVGRGGLVGRGRDKADTPLWLQLPPCLCDLSPGLAAKSDNKYCGCFVPRLALALDHILQLLGVQHGGEEKVQAGGYTRLCDLLLCCDTNSLHLMKRLGQALHIVDIDFVIYECDTWTDPHYAGEAATPQAGPFFPFLLLRKKCQIEILKIQHFFLFVCFFSFFC